jgi:predicted phage terminase large subunit-like protein
MNAEPRDALDDVKWLLGAEYDAIETEWARDDLISFVRRYDPSYKPSWYHFLIAQKLKDVSDGLTQRIIFILPPRHGKSTLVSRYFPAWHLGRHPEEREIAISYAGRLAHRFGLFSRNLVSHPRWPFPDVKLAKDSRSADVWDLEGRNGGYIAAGVDGSITGEGANILLIDDPTKSAREADSETVREATIEWYRETAYPRLQAGGRIVIVGTRWRDDDLLGYVIEQSENGQGDTFEIVYFPAIDEDGQALWPEMFPLEELAKRERNMTRRMWAAQYQGVPITDEGGTFKRWEWKYWHPVDMWLPPVEVVGPTGQTMLVEAIPLPRVFDRSVQSWDATFQETANGSFVVGQVWASLGPRRFLLDQYRARVDFTQSLLAIRTMTAKWPLVVRKLVENKANGPAIISTLRSKIAGIVPVEPSGSKEQRANAVSPFVESGDVYLPHPALYAWVGEKKGFIDEAARFPFGENDDQVDAMTQALLDFETKGASTQTRSNSYAGMTASPTSSNGYQGRRHSGADMWGDARDD